MSEKIEVTDKGFKYKGFKIEPFEDWLSGDIREDVVWFGAEKVVGDTWYWIKRTSLLELVLEIDKKEV